MAAILHPLGSQGLSPPLTSTVPEQSSHLSTVSRSVLRPWANQFPPGSGSSFGADSSRLPKDGVCLLRSPPLRSLLLRHTYSFRSPLGIFFALAYPLPPPPVAIPPSSGGCPVVVLDPFPSILSYLWGWFLPESARSRHFVCTGSQGDYLSFVLLGFRVILVSLWHAPLLLHCWE